MQNRLTNYLRNKANAFLTLPARAVVQQVGTMVTALSLQLHLKAANKWRDQYNPLRSLTMGRAVQHLEAGERGDYADLQWAYRYIEKRDATLRGGKRSLLGAVSEMDWDIKTVAKNRLPKGSTEAQAEAQAITLRTAYDRLSNLTAAIEFLGLAEFRGFSHLEKVPGADGAIEKLVPVEQWYWCRDGRNGPWLYDAECRGGSPRGEQVDMSRFIVREIDDPIDEIAFIAFVRKQLGRKDRDGYIESFAIPSIFAIMPQNVPEAQQGKYQQVVEGIINDSRGALPHGTDIKSVDAGKGLDPFQRYLDDLDKEIVMAITSGQLTMLAQSGSGTLAGGAHTETFQRVARALARRITETFQAQFDLEILAAAHPGQPPLAYFAILCEEEVDTGEVIKDVTGLKSAGFAVDAAWIKEKTGYPVTTALAPVKPGEVDPAAKPDPALPNKAPLNKADSPPPEPPVDITEEFTGLALDDLLTAMHSDCKPLAARLQAIMSADLDDTAFRAALEQLRADLPALAAEVGGNDATVQAYEAILGAAAANQLSDNPPQD